MRAGQSIRFLITRGKPGIHAWDLPIEVDRKTIDIARYQTLLQRAIGTILDAVIPVEKPPDLFDLPVRMEMPIKNNSLAVC